MIIDRVEDKDMHLSEDLPVLNLPKLEIAPEHYEAIEKAVKDLKQAEEAVAACSFIVRCHRAFLVNIRTVVKVDGNSQGYRLRLEGCTEEVPVSRGYAKEIKTLIEGGLYMDKWSGNNRQAQIDNFTAIFLEDTYETIFGRYYIDPEFLHQFDNSAQPMQTSNGDNNSEVCPTLDFVEMFEFDNKDINGKFENFDDNGRPKNESKRVCNGILFI